MSFIQMIPPTRATGETKEVYRYMAKVGGSGSKVPKIVQAFSLRPGSMRRMIRLWELGMWMGDEPRTMRELIGAAVSRLNSCRYWTDAHEANLQAAGGNATRVAHLLNGSAKDTTPLEHELILLIRKSCELPARLEPKDLDPIRDIAGDSALDYALVVVSFHFINRISDLLGIVTEFLPISLRRFEFLRRMSVQLLSVFMAKMDLSNREYGISYNETAKSMAPYFEDSIGKPLGDEFDAIKSRPKLIEALRLVLEERDNRSSLERGIMAKVHHTVEQALPKSMDDIKGFHTRPDGYIEDFAFVGTRYAYRTTKKMIDGLKEEGFDDLSLLDLAIAIADANQWARLYRLFDLPPELFYLK